MGKPATRYKSNSIVAGGWLPILESGVHFASLEDTCYMLTCAALQEGLAMDDQWEISEESSLLELLSRLAEYSSVDVTYRGQVVGSFTPNDLPDPQTAKRAVEHLLKLDVIEPGPGFRFKDLAHEGHKY